MTWHWIALFSLSCSLFGLLSFDEGMEKLRPNETFFQDLSLFKPLYEKGHYEIAPKAEKPRIPKIIHQIWLGSPLPERFKIYTESWKKIHPDWEYRLWTDADVASFSWENRKAFDKAKNYGMKSDIWRLEILKQFGGVYVDTDFQAIKPLDILHSCHTFYTCVHRDGVIINSIIGAAPGHPTLNRCIQAVKKASLKVKCPEDVLEQTGPYMVTRAIVASIQAGETEGMVIYPSIFFFPLSNEERHAFWSGKTSLEQHLRPESFAAHLWATSWVDDARH